VETAIRLVYASTSLSYGVLFHCSKALWDARPFTCDSGLVPSGYTDVMAMMPGACF